MFVKNCSPSASVQRSLHRRSLAVAASLHGIACRSELCATRPTAWKAWSRKRFRSVTMSIEVPDEAAAEPHWVMVEKKKVDPSPCTLSTLICPPIMEHSLRQMTNPSPVPPYTREVLPPSTCAKGWNSFAILSCGMPIPVSLTAKSSLSRSVGPVLSRGLMEDLRVVDAPSGEVSPSGPLKLSAEIGLQLTTMTTSPFAVNLNALERRLARICLMRVTSPMTEAGTESMRR